jgi:hypothetical protein
MNKGSLIPSRTKDFKRASCSFNTTDVILEGEYFDELSAFRARNRWRQGFEASFLLEHDYDFSLLVTPCQERGTFQLRCFFSSACGRYAFWRLTHHQVPELLYLIETAHIPDGGAGLIEMGFASDIRCLDLDDASDPSTLPLRRSRDRKPKIDKRLKTLTPVGVFIESVIGHCKTALSSLSLFSEHPLTHDPSPPDRERSLVHEGGEAKSSQHSSPAK